MTALDDALRTISEAITSSKVNLTPGSEQTLPGGKAQVYAEPSAISFSDVSLDLNGNSWAKLTAQEAEMLGMWLIRSAGEARRWHEVRQFG